jgi:hypothetical protein
MSGFLQPGENRSCVVFGKNEDNTVQVYVQAWDPRGSNRGFKPHPVQSQFPPILPEEGFPALQANFNKAAGNSIDIGLTADGVVLMDCGNQHVRGDYSFAPNLIQWVSQPPTDTIRDARGQLVCAPKDRPGVGRAFQDGNKNWHCQFGLDGHEHDYTSNFVFLNIRPQAAQWKPGLQSNTVNAVRSFVQGAPVCRTNPGGGWPHMEFGWVYSNNSGSYCVLGWGHQSPSFPNFETLYTIP